MEKLNEYLNGKKKLDFAAAVGIAPAHLSQIQHGTKRPSFDVMVKIEKASGGVVDIRSWIPPEDDDAKAG